MSLLGRIKGAIIQELDAGQRRLTIHGPAGSNGISGLLTLTVDDGALVATKHHQLMKLEEFQIGQRVSVIYSPQPGGALLAKAVILERGVSGIAGRSALR